MEMHMRLFAYHKFVYNRACKHDFLYTEDVYDEAE